LEQSNFAVLITTYALEVKEVVWKEGIQVSVHQSGVPKNFKQLLLLNSTLSCPSPSLKKVVPSALSLLWGIREVVGRQPYLQFWRG
jgi:hypothetical protein